MKVKLTKERIEKDLKFFMEDDPIGKMVYDGLDAYDKREVDEPLGKWERFDNRGESFSQEVYGRGGVIGKITYRYVCDELDRFLLRTKMQKKANELVKQPIGESDNRGYVITANSEEVRSL